MNDSEDAFAHMIVDSNDEMCICGNKGCIESYSSIEAMIKRFNLRVKETNRNQEIREEDCKRIFDLAMQNNKSAAEIINKGGQFKEDTIAIGAAAMVVEHYIAK